jgi:hypothetical protein
MNIAAIIVISIVKIEAILLALVTLSAFASLNPAVGTFSKKKILENPAKRIAEKHMIIIKYPMFLMSLCFLISISVISFL